MATIILTGLLDDVHDVGGRLPRHHRWIGFHELVAWKALDLAAELEAEVVVHLWSEPTSSLHAVIDSLCSETSLSHRLLRMPGCEQQVIPCLVGVEEISLEELLSTQFMSESS